MHSSPKISPPCPKNQALKIGGHRYHPWPMSQPRKKWLLQVGRRDTCNRWVWPSPKSRRPLTSEKFCLGIWIWKKKDVPPKKLKNCLVHPWDFHILISWIFGGISNLEFPSSWFSGSSRWTLGVYRLSLSTSRSTVSFFGARIDNSAKQCVGRFPHFSLQVFLS